MTPILQALLSLRGELMCQSTRIGKLDSLENLLVGAIAIDPDSKYVQRRAWKSAAPRN
jgi:hypothetical protein